MTNTELKRTAQGALKSEYGFAPALKDITLLEADRDGTYILFRVGSSKEYRFSSYISHIGGMETIWIGKGTIEKIA